MSNKDTNNDDLTGGGGFDPEQPILQAREASVLDCKAAEKFGAGAVKMVLITLGNSDGSVDLLAVSQIDGVRLSSMLQDVVRNAVVRSANRKRRRPGYPKISEDRIVSVAAMHLDFELSDALKKRQPKLWEYLEKESRLLATSFRRKGRSVGSGEKMRKAIFRLALIGTTVVFRAM